MQVSAEHAAEEAEGNHSGQRSNLMKHGVPDPPALPAKKPAVKKPSE